MPNILKFVRKAVQCIPAFSFTESNSAEVQQINMRKSILTFENKRDYLSELASYIINQDKFCWPKFTHNQNKFYKYYIYKKFFL